MTMMKNRQDSKSVDTQVTLALAVSAVTRSHGRQNEKQDILPSTHAIQAGCVHKNFPSVRQGKFICTAQFKHKATQSALQVHTDCIKLY